MKQTKIFCDHCGKEIDEMVDYVGAEIIVPYCSAEVDLCADCRKELSHYVLSFINQEDEQ